MFKYNDYYYSTGRFEYPIARTVEEALKMKPAPLPDLSELRNNILEAFPYDLWENKKGDVPIWLQNDCKIYKTFVLNN